MIDKLNAESLPFLRNGSENHLAGHLSLSFKDADGEALLHRLDLMGICVSTGAACDSKSTKISHVLEAISLDESYARGTIRISFGRDNTEEEAADIADSLVRIVIPEPGEQLALGNATIDILGPIWYSSNMNDLSLIIKITYGSTSFLFTGDAEWDEEHDLIEAGIDISADVLKVAHHGSDSSTSYVFLREVAPTYAVISVSKESQYGHPHSETLSRLEDAGVIVYRTDLQGTIECVSDGKTIAFLQ